MTTVRHDEGVGTVDAELLTSDLGALREALAGHLFPSQQDDLMAACLGGHLPARVCGRLSVLQRTHVYRSLDEVLDDVRSAITAGADPA